MSDVAFYVAVVFAVVEFILSLVFCKWMFLDHFFRFVMHKFTDVDAIGDHMVEAHSNICLVIIMRLMSSCSALLEEKTEVVFD